MRPETNLRGPCPWKVEIRLQVFKVPSVLQRPGVPSSEGLGLGFIPFGVSSCRPHHPHFKPLPRLVDPGCRQPPGALAQGGGHRSAVLPSVII